MKICSECGKEFEPIKNAQKLCSKECIKNRLKKYQQKYRQKPEVKQKERQRQILYLQKPGVEKYRKKYHKDYYERPEVKARVKLNSKIRNHIRNISIIDAFHNSDELLSISDLMKRTDLPKDILHSLLFKSIKIGSILQEDGLYRLNPLFASCVNGVYEDWKKKVTEP